MKHHENTRSFCFWGAGPTILVPLVVVAYWGAVSLAHLHEKPSQNELRFSVVEKKWFTWALGVDMFLLHGSRIGVRRGVLQLGRVHLRCPHGHGCWWPAGLCHGRSEVLPSTLRAGHRAGVQCMWLDSLNRSVQFPQEQRWRITLLLWLFSILQVSKL